MSVSQSTLATQAFVPAVPSRIDSATTESLVAMRLSGEGQAVASVDAARRYGVTDPSSTLPSSRVSS